MSRRHNAHSSPRSRAPPEPDLAAVSATWPEEVSKEAWGDAAYSETSCCRPLTATARQWIPRLPSLARQASPNPNRLACPYSGHTAANPISARPRRPNTYAKKPPYLQYLASANPSLYCKERRQARHWLAQTLLRQTLPPKQPPLGLSLSSSARRVSGIPGLGPPRASPTTSNAPVFKRPYARPPSRQNKLPPQQTPTAVAPKEDDALGSLDGFRSASRASSRAGSRTGFYDDSPEITSPLESVVSNGNEDKNENELELELTKISSKKSRPSLSERTIESLSQLPSSPAVSRRRRSSLFRRRQQHATAPSACLCHVEFEQVKQ